MSTTEEQLELIMEAIGEFMRSRGHDVEMGNLKHSVYLKNSSTRTVLMREFKGTKWHCSVSTRTFPIDLVEPGSLEKIEKVMLHCAQKDRQCSGCLVGSAG